MKHRLITLMLALMLGLGVLTGCGGEGEEDEGSENSPGMVQPGEGGEDEGDD